MNTPIRGNKYMLFILAFQIAVSFLIPYVNKLIGINLFGSQLSIIPLHIILFILPFAGYLLLTAQKPTEVLQLRGINMANCGLIVLMCITIQPLMMVMSGLSTLIFPNNISAVMSELQELPLVVMVTATSLTPAISEEITMRGVLLSNYKNVSIRKAALINGLLFGILHLDLQQFMYAFLLGYMFTYFVYYTKSILASVVAHFTINFIQTLLAYLSYSVLEKTGAALDAAEQVSNAELLPAIISFSVVAVVFTPVCIVLFRAFAYYNRQRLVTEAMQPDNNEDTAADTPDFPSNARTDIFNWPLAAIIIIFICFVVFNLYG